MNNNTVWLRKQVSNFLSSKLDDTVLFTKSGMIRDAAAKRGIPSRDVTRMFILIKSREGFKMKRSQADIWFSKCIRAANDYTCARLWKSI